jgi:hypothetical protein
LPQGFLLGFLPGRFHSIFSLLLKNVKFCLKVLEYVNSFINPENSTKAIIHTQTQVPVAALTCLIVKLGVFPFQFLKLELYLTIHG